MHRVHLTYPLEAGNDGQRDLHHPLMALLAAVHDAGSISGAARRLSLSYRHVWGELKRWEAELGQTLVLWVKGQPALLSPFGEKLLWAERRAQARLAPQVEALRSELLRRAVRRDRLREDVRSMRERMRAELSKARPGEFDLKQDAGGITDIEFLAQYWTLLHAERYPELVTFSDNIRQLESLASADLVAQATVDVLTHAYRTYRHHMHHLSLEGAGNLVPAEQFAQMREQVASIWRATMES